MRQLNIIDYKVSQRFGITDIPFDALIAGAMRKADTGNMILLREAFPGIAKDLQERYNAGGGFLDDEEKTVNHKTLQAVVDNYYPIN